ncbi:MAG: PD-(D/E)XK nuclease family protein, partial [Natronomonas sp.]|nr:PD-(D/E)XK nuclease family protein [Natronomonas sp.]
TTDALDAYEQLGFERERIDGSATSLTDVTNAMYRPDPEAVHCPDRVRWRELPTPEREIRFVARELRTELADGCDPDEIAVVIPGMDAYAGYVEDAFDTFEIPYTITAASQLDRTLTGSVVHDLLALAEPDPRAENLTSLLASPLTDLLPTEHAADVTAKTRRRDTVSLNSILDAVDEETKVVVEKLLERLEPLRTGDVKTAVEALRGLLDDELALGDSIDEYASGADRTPLNWT